jgi:hypothetical protein
MQLPRSTEGGDKMSESALTLKKVIPIIIVTWLLSSVTTLAIVYFSPNIFPKTWHVIETFEGWDTDKLKTQLYRNWTDVPSMHWRIGLSVKPYNWTLSDPNEDAKFQLTVDDLTLRELDWEDIGLWYVSKDYFTGSGRHYIDVYADGDVEWVINIWAYY